MLKVYAYKMGKDLVDQWIKSGSTYEQVSEKLQKLNPGKKGLSARSVRRFCHRENITKMTEEEIDDTVGQSVCEVCDVL